MEVLMLVRRSLAALSARVSAAVFAAVFTAVSTAVFALVFAAGCAGPAADNGSTPVPPGPDQWRIRPVPLERVTVDDAFWSPRMQRNQSVTIPHIIEQNELGDQHDNFRRAAGELEGRFEGWRFNDTDVYKVVEAASYSLQQNYDAELDGRIDELVAMIAAAQEDDGYLFPAWSADPDNPANGVGTERWAYVHGNSHELYGAGHLFEAAVAHYEATGKRSLLEVAIRLADLIDATFGPDAIRDVPGHEEVELALVKLARVTGEERYVELARFFLDQRGQPHDGPEYPEGDPLLRYSEPIYRQDHLPVTEQREAVGHSVRAMYLYTGMADVAARRDDTGYEPALEALWQDVVGTKMYLTGGIGAAGSIEGFGDSYQLPNQTAYAETCAAIGLDLWNHRMFLATGESRFLDVMERAIYNGILSGVSYEGDTFFYTNPLESEDGGERREYFGVACCPANIARLVAQLPGFIYATRDDEIYVNLFVGSTAEIELPGGTVRLTQETDYPWDGKTTITVDVDEPMEFALRVRFPGWAKTGQGPVPTDLYRWTDDTWTDLTVRPLNGDGEPVREPVDSSLEDGWLTIDRTWRSGEGVSLGLTLLPRRVAAHPNVEENAGKLAIQAGPLVYAAEAIDNGGSVRDLVLPADAELTRRFDPDLLGGLMVIRGTALRDGVEVPFTAIPYFAWANRGRGEMAVWLRTGEERDRGRR
jgi:DUF1680 family protein